MSDNNTVKPEKLIYRTAIEKVEERFTEHYDSGIGKDAVFQKRSLGWFIVFIGGFSVYAGQTKPTFDKYQEVKITIEGAT